MLVSELKNASLLCSITSKKSFDYSQVHVSLIQCARSILAKYEQKQGYSEKREIKTRALNILLDELYAVPKDSHPTRATILSALNSHAEALYLHEHLLSAKGNNYALMEQTQILGVVRSDYTDRPAALLLCDLLKIKPLWLSAEQKQVTCGYNDIRASLLRYHRLKNKLLGPDTPLSAEQKQVISELAEKKILTITILDMLEFSPGIGPRVLAGLHKEGLLEPDSGLIDPHSSMREPDLCVKVLKHTNPDSAATAIIELSKTDQFTPDLCAKVLEHENPDIAVRQLCGINESTVIAAMETEAYQQQSNQHSNTTPLLSSTSATPGFSSNMPDRVRIDIRNALKKAGYPLDKCGIAYGIAWTALLACVRQDGQAYMQRMYYLELLELLELQKQMPLPLPDADDRHQLYHFFDAVTLSTTSYRSMNGYAKGIGYPGRQEVAFPGSIIGSDKPGYQVPVVKHAFIVECSASTLVNFLQQTRENNKGIPFGVMIKYATNVICIGFDGSRWLAADYNSYNYTEERSILCHFLRKQSLLHKEHNIIAAVEVVAANEHSLHINNDALVVNVKGKKSNFVPLTLHVALQYGDKSVTKNCIKAISERAHPIKILLGQLICKDEKGTPGFYMALQNGHSDAITSFIETSAMVITALDLPGVQKNELMYELLTSRGSDDMPGFCMALQNGHADAITAFIQASKTAISRLSNTEHERTERLYQLFHCIKNANKPDFLAAMEQGGPAVNKAFTEGIARLPLSEAQKEVLIYPTFDSA